MGGQRRAAGHPLSLGQDIHIDGELMNANVAVMSCLPAAACLLFTGSVLIYHLLGPHHMSWWQEYCLYFQTRKSRGSEKSSDFLKVTQHVESQF